MKRIDANVILRYLLDDHAEFSVRAVEIIENDMVFTSFEVVCEVIYVLERVYRISRLEIVNALVGYLGLQNVSTEDFKVLFGALNLYSNEKIDIVDAILCSHHIVHGDEIVSFDKKLMKLIG